MSLGLMADKAFVIRPAVDPDFFSPADGSPSPPPLKVLMVGSLVWYKNQSQAILGLKYALDAGTPVLLSIVGDGPDREKLMFLVRELGLEKVVQFLGTQSTEEVHQAMQSNHVFLHTSLSEGIANVILEAMSCALPVISTAAGGIGEVITDGQNGLLVPTRDSHSVANKISELFHNPELRLMLGKQARQSVLDNYTQKKQTEMFISLYEKVFHHI
jgi:colanic acid/amylovoran biosynthesis glycosyltransferase